MRFLIQIVANALGIALASLAIRGFAWTGNLKVLILAGAVLAVANAIVRPLLKLFSFPLIIITFGLFLAVINMIVLKVVDYLFDTLSIVTVGALFWGTLLISIVNGLVFAFVKKKES